RANSDHGLNSLVAKPPGVGLFGMNNYVDALLLILLQVRVYADQTNHNCNRAGGQEYLPHAAQEKERRKYRAESQRRSGVMLGVDQNNGRQRYRSHDQHVFYRQRSLPQL